MISETTDGVTTAYDYGVERISAYEKIGWSTLKTDYVYDGRGSVAQEVTYNNSWYTFGGFLSTKGVNSYTYTPFGELLSGEGAGFRFNGEYYDSATGMLNLRVRQYELGVMRFNQRDLLKGDQSAPLSLNRYLYCENDSVNFVDPSGKSLSELWEKAKTVVSNGVTAAKKVAAAAYNAGKTVVKSTIQQVATVVKPVVNKIVNTVKEVVTVAKTQGLAAAAKTLVSNVVSALAYVKNVITGTVAERQAIQAKTGQEISNIAQNTVEELTKIANATYGVLSPRNQDILDNASAQIRELQANGASAFEIAKVMLKACTDMAKNVGGTLGQDVSEEILQPTGEWLAQQGQAAYDTFVDPWFGAQTIIRERTEETRWSDKWIALDPKDTFTTYSKDYSEITFRLINLVNMKNVDLEGNQVLNKQELMVANLFSTFILTGEKQEIGVSMFGTEMRAGFDTSLPLWVLKPAFDYEIYAHSTDSRTISAKLPGRVLATLQGAFHAQYSGACHTQGQAGVRG